MEQEVIELRRKRLESLVISAGADIADAVQIAEQASTLSLISGELIISAQKKMEEVYLLMESES